MGIEVELKPNERIEDLQSDGLVIIQSANEYRFTSDAVLLANFVQAARADVVVDFGAGGGVIAILLANKQKPKKIYAVEIQPQLADMASRSVRVNGLESVIEVVNCDIKGFSRRADVVACNPPYRKAGSGQTQEKENLRICRHEEKVTLDEIVECAARVLKHRGKLYLVHKAGRTAEIFASFARHGIEPKLIQPICRRGQAADVVLLCGIKGAAPDLKWLPPLER